MSGSSLQKALRAVRALTAGSMFAVLGHGCGGAVLRGGGFGGEGAQGKGSAGAGDVFDAGSGGSAGAGAGGAGALDGGGAEDALLGSTQSPQPGPLALTPDTLAFSTGTETLTAPLGGGAPSILATAQKHTVGLVIAGSTIYWANSGSSPQNLPGSDGSIMSVPLGGGPATILADGQNQPTAIAVDGANVYWTTEGLLPGGMVSTAGGAVWALPMSGGTPTSLANGFPDVGPIAAASGVVVFAASLTGNPRMPRTQIMKVSPTGGDAAVIASTDRTVTSIALDGTTVYWTDADSPWLDVSGNDGQIRAAKLDGSQTSILASHQPAPMGLSVIAQTLFWCDAGDSGFGTRNVAGVWSMPAAGGDATAIANGLPIVGACAADGAHVAWVAVDYDFNGGGWKLVVQPR